MIPADKIRHVVFRRDPAIVQRIEGRLIEAYGNESIALWEKPRASGISDCERAQVLKASLPEGTIVKKHLRNFLSTRIGTFVHELIQEAGWGEEAIAEETIENAWLRGHSDHRFVADGILVDYKTAFVDDWFDVAVGIRPQKTEHVIQANWYAVMHGCSMVAIVYFNRNLKLTEHLRRTTEWGRLLEHDRGASETLTAIAFQADPALARAADRKAARILDHVAAGTLPAYDAAAEMLVPYKGECHFCEVRQLCRQARESAQVSEPAAPAPDDDGSRVEQWNTLVVEDGRAIRVQWESWPSKVVGTTHRSDIPWANLKPGDRLDLEWDYLNPKGPRYLEDLAQAIKVVHRDTDAFLGYLPATKSSTAGKVCAHLHRLGLVDGRAGDAFAIITEVTGGTEDKANRGINIQLTLCAPEAPPSETAAPTPAPAIAGN
ncbi:hypothetical protein J7643_03600 [bacterium]|nr:hypothetical protein [bacterium]